MKHKHAKFFTIFVSIILLAYGALGFYFLPLASFQGDLTRIGMLPESQFGWRKPQPKIEQQWLAQASMQEADVLVIGDSFSEDLVWQSVLTRHGLKVHTEHWRSIRESICADFTQWARQQGFHGKFLIIQTVERGIDDRISKSISCQTTQAHTDEFGAGPRHPPQVPFDPDHLKRDGRLSVGIRTALNFGEYQRYSSSSNFKAMALPNGAKIVRVNNGCELFSHASCGDSLFLAADKVEDLPDATLDNIERLNKRMTGIVPIWAVVPNKSTAYLYPDKQFWNKAEQRFKMPNLLRMSEQAIQSKMLDLYPANNSHLSTNGYLLMGEDIFKTMQTAQLR